MYIYIYAEREKERASLYMRQEPKVVSAMAKVIPKTPKEIYISQNFVHVSKTYVNSRLTAIGRLASIYVEYMFIYCIYVYMLMYNGIYVYIVHYSR